MNQEYLNVDNLSFEYPDGFKALENINLSLSKGERLAVLGPNGAGKTTLILHLNGILGDLNGQISLNNKDFSCLLYTSPSPRDGLLSRMPSSA